MSDDIPEWAWKRVNEEIEKHGLASSAFAAYIAKHKQPPVDPLLVMAREAACEDDFNRRGEGGGRWRTACREGAYDSGEEVQSALIALRMAQEQGWSPA